MSGSGKDGFRKQSEISQFLSAFDSMPFVVETLACQVVKLFCVLGQFKSSFRAPSHVIEASKRSTKPVRPNDVSSS